MAKRIAIVDDRSQVLLALTRDLSYSGMAEIVFTAANGEAFLEQMKQLPGSQHPQVVLMDIEMPVMDGIEAVRQGSILYPDVQFIMLTVFDSEDKIFEAIKAGASGYLLKEEPANIILKAIDEIMDKQGVPMSPRVARKTLEMLADPSRKTEDRVPEAMLSAREMEILQAQVNGMNYKQIAEKLFISPNTVRNHIANIYEKLHITSKSQAVKVAIKNKWV